VEVALPYPDILALKPWKPGGFNMKKAVSAQLEDFLLPREKSKFVSPQQSSDLEEAEYEDALPLMEDLVESDEIDRYEHMALEAELESDPDVWDKASDYPSDEDTPEFQDDFDKDFYSRARHNGYSRNGTTFRLRVKKWHKHEKLHTKGLKHVMINLRDNDQPIIHSRRYVPQTRFTATWEPAPVVPSLGRRAPQGQDAVSVQFERDLQAALAASMSSARTPAPLPGIGLTERQILELSSRELTPEDYELLLLLDQSLAPKTCDHKKVEEMKLVIVESLAQLADRTCSVCLEDYELGDVLKEVPCPSRHLFHEDCVTQWLTKAGRTCPLDGIEI
jgi:hypothetical protein